LQEYYVSYSIFKKESLFTAKMIKRLCLGLKLVLLIPIFPSLLQSIQASPLQGILLAEIDSNQNDLAQEQPMGMFAILLQHNQNLFHFDQQQASYTRSWSDLNKLGNACMYNKFKSTEREQVAYFSQKPISIFPPLRLIVLKKYAAQFPQQIDLANLPPSLKGQIGVVTSRSYGEAINPILLAHPESFYFRSGMGSTLKLLEMLAKERVAGVIEYSKEASLIQNLQGLNFDFQAIPIKGVMRPNFGYMACSKTAAGEKLIANIDLIMATPAFKQAFIEEHLQNFDDDEKALLKPELDKLLQP
jgi:uncharacterized protein (TIGR02285 family)